MVCTSLTFLTNPQHSCHPGNAANPYSSVNDGNVMLLQCVRRKVSRTESCEIEGAEAESQREDRPPHAIKWRKRGIGRFISDGPNRPGLGSFELLWDCVQLSFCVPLHCAIGSGTFRGGIGYQE